MSNDLGLCNIEAIHARVEDLSFTYDGTYDYILGRAVAPMHKFIQWCVVGYNLYDFETNTPNFAFFVVYMNQTSGWERGSVRYIGLLSSKDGGNGCVCANHAGI